MDGGTGAQRGGAALDPPGIWMHSLGVMQSVRCPPGSPDAAGADVGWPANSEGGRGAIDLGAMDLGAIVGCAGATGAIGAAGGATDSGVCATAGTTNRTDQTTAIGTRIT